MSFQKVKGKWVFRVWGYVIMNDFCFEYKLLGLVCVLYWQLGLYRQCLEWYLSSSFWKSKETYDSKLFVIQRSSFFSFYSSSFWTFSYSRYILLSLSSFSLSLVTIIPPFPQLTVTVSSLPSTFVQGEVHSMTVSLKCMRKAMNDLSLQLRLVKGEWNEHEQKWSFEG